MSQRATSTAPRQISAQPRRAPCVILSYRRFHSRSGGTGSCPTRRRPKNESGPSRTAFATPGGTEKISERPVIPSSVVIVSTARSLTPASSGSGCGSLKTIIWVWVILITILRSDDTLHRPVSLAVAIHAPHSLSQRSPPPAGGPHRPDRVESIGRHRYRRR